MSGRTWNRLPGRGMANAVSRLRNTAGTRVLAVQAGLALTKKAWGTPGCPSHLRSTWSNTDFKMKDVMTFVDRVKAALTGDVMNLDMAKEKAWIAFDREEDLSTRLLTTSDSDFGGRSTCMLEVVEGESPEQSALKFSGSLSLAIPQAQGLACAYPYSDPAVFVAEQRGIFYGKTSKQPVRSGLCALGSRIDAMNIDLEHYNALSIRLKGDGRKYMINLRTQALREGDLYQTVIMPPAGQWTTLSLPFQDFVLTNQGFVNTSELAMNTRAIVFFGISINDNKEGPFRLLRETTIPQPLLCNFMIDMGMLDVA